MKPVLTSVAGAMGGPPIAKVGQRVKMMSAKIPETRQALMVS